MVQKGSRFLLVAILFGCALPSSAWAQFPTSNVEFLSQVPLSSMGGGGGADLWGWTDPQTGREYALFTRTNGTSFIDVTDPTQPVYLGNLPTHTGSTLWRDVKVYQNYAYVVSDNNGPHGIQIFDLTTLRNFNGTPQTYASTAHYDGIRDAHNIAINEDSGFAYAIATNLGNVALDLSNPTAPVLAGNVAGGHDVQVVNYNGPDQDYVGREILVASPGNSRIVVQDVTDKQNVTQISNPRYAGGQYSHQGWFTDDQRYFYLNDEFDDRWTHMWDMSDLDDPIYQGFIPALEDSIDHNLYVNGNYIYAANYTAGLQVFRIDDPANAQINRVASIDTFPASDGMFYDGAWSVYPFLDSGTLLISDMSNGLIVARLDLFDGDFDHNGEMDCADVDQLAAAVASGQNDLAYDLSGDGEVDLDDRDLWLVEAGAANSLPGAYLAADANLDGTVDGQDFVEWNDNKFTTNASFCSGDFDMNGAVDGADFIIWNDLKFTASDQRSGHNQVVPEPGSLVMSCGLLVALVGRRRLA